MGACRRAFAVFSLMRLGPAMLPLSKILPQPHCDLSAASASFLLSVLLHAKTSRARSVVPAVEYLPNMRKSLRLTDGDDGDDDD